MLPVNSGNSDTIIVLLKIPWIISGHPGVQNI